MSSTLAELEARHDITHLRAGWRALDRWETRWERSFTGLLRETVQRQANIPDLIAFAQDNWAHHMPVVEKGVWDRFTDFIQRVVSCIRAQVATDQFETGAQALYIGLALDEGEDAGQFTLDALGLNRTFRWAGQRDFIRDELAIRGSKIIQRAYGNHLEELAKIIIEGTDPARPRTLAEIEKDIRERWTQLTRYEASRIARTEAATIWERTNWYSLSANGVTSVKWVIATGPAIGTRVGEVCELCRQRAAEGPYPLDGNTPIPPAHPNCRCTLVADIGPGWLPPKEPFTGSEDPPDIFPADDSAPRVRVRKSAGYELLITSEHIANELLEPPYFLEPPQWGVPEGNSGWAVVEKSVGWTPSLHPHGFHGHWANTGGTGREAAHAGEKLAAHPFRDPPAPMGVKGGRRAGGFAASGHTATKLGDLAEAVVHQELGLRTLLVGRRQGPLDAAWDHTYGFEIKAVTTSAREYKVAMKTNELAEKAKAADEAGLKAALMMVVMDLERGEAHVYWREGIKNGRLNDSFNFLATVPIGDPQQRLAA